MTLVAPHAHALDAAPVEEALPRRRFGFGVWTAIVWLAIISLAALLADVLPLFDPSDTHAGIPLSKPTSQNWLGTDELGRDLLSRTIYGARVSLVVGFSAVILSTLIGGALGLMAGFYRRHVESVTLFLADVLLAFPSLLLAVSIVAFTDSRGILTVTLAIALLYLGPTVRIVRALTLSTASREFVTAAEALGARSRRIIFRELLPNVMPTLMSLAMVAVAGAMIAEGGLAYLNLSVAPPTPTWGAMMAAGKARVDESLYPVMVPATAMFLTVLSITLIGDYIQKRQQRGRGAI
jgi:peptide/nickel transport system permease protein